MDNNWIVEQTEYNVSQWDKSMENIDPSVKQWNRNPDRYYNRVCIECNFFDSVKVIEWEKYIAKDSKVLDLGCGGGWLSAYLSTFMHTKSILALDTSKNYLFNIMPGVINILKGDSSKITPIEGMFTPLLIQEKSLNMVVASAAVHHADNLEAVLTEIGSKLKSGGYLMILNETPQGYIRYIARIILSFFKLLTKTVIKQYETVSPKISASGFEYDAYLGDRSYPLWYWENAIHRAGFEIIELVDSNLPTLKNTKQVTLKHFICQKV